MENSIRYIKRQQGHVQVGAVCQLTARCGLKKKKIYDS